MSAKSWAIDIDRDDITQAHLVEDAGAPLASGQVRVHLDSYAMTANNITYAVFGKPAGLFGNDQGYGISSPSATRPAACPSGALRQ